jgi:hypothetical protein
VRACPFTTVLKSKRLFFKYSIHPSRNFGIWKSPRYVYPLDQHHALIYVHTPTSDYLADSVDAFLTSNTESPQSPSKPDTFDIESPAIPLGLTFSFPVEQTARDKGFLLTWTKGFSAKNAINKDVVKLLQDAFDRKHLHVKCVALVNDVSLHVLFPFATKISLLTYCDLDSRHGSFSRIYCWRMRPRCDIRHRDERRVPRTSSQHHQAQE